MAARVLMVDAIFFAELSRVGCRTRGVDGRLFHARSGRMSGVILSCHDANLPELGH